MIITCLRHIPFLWIVLAVLPWSAVFLKDKTMGIAFVYSMNKFVENPAALTFLLSMPALLSWVVPPTVNFLADRVWTRFGRRKPFVSVAWVGTITCIFLMPLAPSFGWLLAAYMAFCVFNDLGGPVESLKMEIVPPAQRGISAAVNSFVIQIAVLVFFVAGLGRFNEVTSMFNLPVTGEQGLFWTVSMAMVVMVLFVMLGIKETDPKSRLTGQRFTPRNIFAGLLASHLWPVYILAFSSALLGSGLGILNNLLVTEQWQYSLQDLGNNIAIGGLINLVLIPTLGLLASRMGRFNIYLGLVIAGILVNACLYSYYSFVLYDGRPTILEMVVFGELLSIIGILTAMAYTPLVYDYVTRNELGTYAAGAGLVGKGTGWVTTNLVGFFFWLYTVTFMPPAGEMVRITLAEPSTRQVVEAEVRSAAWTDPAAGTPLADPELTARAWYQTGAKIDDGRAFEIRLRNVASERLRAERDEAEGVMKNAMAREKYAKARLTKAAAKGSATAALAADLAREGAIIASCSATVAAREAELARRATAFQAQVQARFADRLLPDGAQILASATAPAVLVQVPLTGRPAAAAVEATLDAMRDARPELIDLRIVPVGDGLAVELSLMADADPAAAAQVAIRALEAQADPAFATLLAVPASTAALPLLRQETAICLDLRTVEDPLDRHPSPITRVIDGMFPSYFRPERRLRAMGRGARRDGWIGHVATLEIPDDHRAIRVRALVGAVPDTHRFALAATVAGPAPAGTEVVKAEERPSAAVLARLGELGAADGERAGALYAVLARSAKEQRTTIARPVLVGSYAKQQYDYLAGYLAIFILQLIGVGFVLTFMHMVKTGKVTPRGALEAEARS